jgi:rSAM/selenodomain-associated transferase 2
MKLSIIVPILNEARQLPGLLASLAEFRSRGVQVVLVDGDSADGSVELAEGAGFHVVRSDRGRARQMNAGAAVASGDVFLFLHADTILPTCADALIVKAFMASPQSWGRFDVHIDGRPPMLALVGFMMNWRSRLTGIATGDQAMFVRRDLFREVGGFPLQPLMEDIELSRRLKRISAPLGLRARVKTSGRRWETRGVWPTILLMWTLRLRYWLGAPAERLAKAYR